MSPLPVFTGLGPRDRPQRRRRGRPQLAEDTHGMRRRAGRARQCVPSTRSSRCGRQIDRHANRALLDANGVAGDHRPRHSPGHGVGRRAQRRPARPPPPAPWFGRRSRPRAQRPIGSTAARASLRPRAGATRTGGAPPRRGRRQGAPARPGAHDGSGMEHHPHRRRRRRAHAPKISRPATRSPRRSPREAPAAASRRPAHDRTSRHRVCRGPRRAGDDPRRAWNGPTSTSTCLAAQVKRAAELIGFCRDRIGSARLHIEQVVADLNDDTQADGIARRFDGTA